MKKSRLYRVGAALMAAAMVFTCMPQTGLYVRAEEELLTQENLSGTTTEKPSTEETPGEDEGNPPVQDTPSEDEENPSAQDTPGEDGENPPAHDTPGEDEEKPSTEETPGEDEGNPPAQDTPGEDGENPSIEETPGEDEKNLPAQDTPEEEKNPEEEKIESEEKEPEYIMEGEEREEEPVKGDGSLIIFHREQPIYSIEEIVCCETAEYLVSSFLGVELDPEEVLYDPNEMKYNFSVTYNNSKTIEDAAHLGPPAIVAWKEIQDDLIKNGKGILTVDCVCEGPVDDGTGTGNTVLTRFEHKFPPVLVGCYTYVNTNERNIIYKDSTELTSDRLAQDINFMMQAENPNGGSPIPIDFPWPMDRFTEFTLKRGDSVLEDVPFYGTNDLCAEMLAHAGQQFTLTLKYGTERTGFSQFTAKMRLEKSLTLDDMRFANQPDEKISLWYAHDYLEVAPAAASFGGTYKWESSDETVLKVEGHEEDGRSFGDVQAIGPGTATITVTAMTPDGTSGASLSHTYTAEPEKVWSCRLDFGFDGDYISSMPILVTRGQTAAETRERILESLLKEVPAYVAMSKGEASHPCQINIKWDETVANYKHTDSREQTFDVVGELLPLVDKEGNPITVKERVTVSESLYAPVTVQFLEDDPINLTMWEKKKLSVSSDTTDSYQWESSDEKVIKLGEDGNATAVGKGTATVTVTVVDEKGNPYQDLVGEDVTAQCTIEVSDLAASADVVIEPVKPDSSTSNIVTSEPIKAGSLNAVSLPEQVQLKVTTNGKEETRLADVEWETDTTKWTRVDTTVKKIANFALLGQKAAQKSGEEVTYSVPGKVVGVVDSAGKAMEVTQLVTVNTATYRIVAPTKTVYLTGETLVLDGAKLINEANEKDVVKVTEAMVKGGFDSSKEGVCTVKVEHNGAELSFDVLVVEAPTDLTMKLDQSLSDISLSDFTNTYGTWLWSNPTEQPNGEGKKDFLLTFKPNPENTAKFTARTDIPVKVQVSKRNVKIICGKVDGKTYDGKAYAYTGTVSLRDTETEETVISGNVSLQTAYTGKCVDGHSYNSADGPVNAGSYTLTFSLAGADAELYQLTETETAPKSFNFEIEKRELRIIAEPFEIDVDEVDDQTRLKLKYKVEGLADGDSLVKGPDLLAQGFAPPYRAGTYTIIPSGADLGTNANYKIEYENGILTVTGDDPAADNRERVTVEFDTIKVKDSNYSGKKHSISGYPLWSKKEIPLNCQFRVTGTTSGGDPYDSKSIPVKLTYSGVKEEVEKAYSEIAPAECGSYTFEITVLLDETKYNYTGSGFRAPFQILPLKPYETKLIGMTGIAGKTYDGTPVDFSSQIRAARVQSKQGDDIAGYEKLEFGIRGKTAGSETEDYKVPIDPSNPSANMPSAAGSYTLWVKLIGTNNYLENIWEIPFVIKQKALTVTVEDKKIHVHADGSQLGDYTYVITDEEGNVLPNDGFREPVIAPVGEVDTTKAGEYELVASGDIAGGDYDVVFVNGKLYIQAQLWGVKEPNLTQNMNVPNGKSLEEIAEKYLPNTVTIYLDQEKQITDSAAIMWDTVRPYAGSYNDKNTSPQSFKMKGTVVLPDVVYVEEENRDWLTVIVDVSVREACEGKALRPYADVKAGTVGEGTKVSLFTDEPDPKAQIYYTVEADNPSLSTNQRLYSGSIEVRCTMTIRAITRVYGKQDSEELRLNYYFDRNLKPVGPDDPDDPDNPSVPDEDIPKDDNGNLLPIPEGLWVTDVKGCVYTGKAIKPEVRVYDYKKRLEEKKDYTISYKNNVNAADKNSAKAPTITIKGKGNYEGTLLKTFTIAQKSINDPDVKADHLTVAFNNKQQTPAPTVTWNGKKLKNKKDYSFEAVPQMAVGKYSVTLHGAGNYTGDRVINFTISNATPAAKLTVGKLPAYTYTGEEITPEPVVKSGKEVLQKGKDYTLSYEDNIEVGTASILIAGAENSRFAGVKRVTFQIKEAAVLNKAKAELRFASPTIYTGKEITASEYFVTVQVQVGGVKQERTLVKDTDYRVTYQNNVKAGTATAVFEGINAYKGTLKKTFKISPYELHLDRNKLLDIKTQESYPYMKGGSTPKPVITFDGKTLKEGTDYTVSYKNNGAAGSPATMNIKGKGNFTGTVARGFNVEVQDIAQTSVEPADKVFQNKANIYKTKIRVLDTNGKQLAAGKDYNKVVIYAYANDTKLLNGVEKKADEEVMSTDIIPAGTTIKVTVTAAGANYRGTAIGEYKIVQSDIAKAKVTIPKQTYTGKPIELKESDLTVLMNGVVVPASEYKIIGYSSNVNKGTAKLTLRGQGNFGGTKTVSFTIRGKNLLGQIFG